MTPEENKQRIKNEALNKIRKIYNQYFSSSNELYKKYSHYEEDGSYAEQREYWIRHIIMEMERELKNYKKN